MSPHHFSIRVYNISIGIGTGIGIGNGGRTPFLDSTASFAEERLFLTNALFHQRRRKGKQTIEDC